MNADRPVKIYKALVRQSILSNTHRRFEHHETVGIVMCVQALASITVILAAIRAPKPDPHNRLHTAITDCSGVHDILKVFW
jgi:hypothetical protein